MLQLILSMFLFGTIGVFVRSIPLPSGVIAMVRGVAGTLFLLLVIAIKGSRLSFADMRRNLPRLCFSGICLGANWILLFEAYRYTTVATATLCYYCAPILVMLVSPLLFKEKLTLLKGICAALALVGMALISGVLHAPASGQADMRGILCGLGAALLYACVIVSTKRLNSISALDGTVVQLAVSAIVIAPYALFVEKLGAQSFPPQSLILLAIVGVVHTGLAYALYFGAIKRLPAQTVALFSYIDPIVAILASALLLKERMTPGGVIGAILILGSTLASEIIGRKPRMRR